MTAETIHTCSYECDRPECIRAQRDELAARLTVEANNARGEVVAWFPTNAQGEIIRNYGDGSPVYACRTKEEAEQARRCHLGATGPVIPLYAAPPPAAVDEAMVDRACDAYVQIADDCMGLVRRKAMRAALTAALAAQHQEPTT